jgi:hypothetical protein
MATSIQHLLLTPQVLEKLEMIQQQPPQSMTLHLSPSKSAENRPQTQLVQPEKSTSLTLAQRRNNAIPASLTLSTKAKVSCVVSYSPNILSNPVLDF